MCVTPVAACSTWCLAAIYGLNFGVELTINNIVNGYFIDHFNTSILIAGLCGATFGLMNLFSRSLGGLMSDQAARRWGMRGRLWTLVINQVHGCNTKH